MFIFFFKQKTAYEMRISDWSSDVCSSDLITASRLVKIDIDGNVVGEPGAFNKAGFTIHSACYMARPEVNCVVHLHTRSSIAVAAQQIGRASCRERVCPYV